MKKFLSVIMMAALLFASVPATGGNAYAAKRPARVKSISLNIDSSNTIKVSWKKVKKGVAGYTIYRNGKAIKSVSKSKKSFKDKGLKPSTKYTYYVRAYTNVNTKQWYNKETGKWQTKKPDNSVLGESRTVKTKLYGKASRKLSMKTFKKTGKRPKAGTWKYGGRTIKASECPVKFVVKGTECPVCKKGGVVATVKYSKGKFEGEQKGVDYRKTCHHCDTFMVVKCYAQVPGMYFKTTKRMDSSSEDSGCQIDPATGAVISDMTFRNHTHEGRDEPCKYSAPLDGLYFCKTCKKMTTDW